MAPDHNHQHHQASRALKPLCSSRCSCCSTNENGSKNKFLKSYKYKHKLKSYNQEKKTSVKLVQERITSINPPRLDCDKLTPAMHSPTTTTNQIDQEFSQDRGQKFRRIIDSTTATPSEQYPDHESALINHKSYHPVRHRVDGNNRVAVTPTINDQTTTTTVPMLYSRLQRVCRPLITILITLQLIISCQLHTAHAFCPARCHCNDLDLSANCTQITSISIVPMTLNPLLKRLILNQLPIVELSNSLSIYHQLEYLNMNANQLTRIRYQNFNFKPAPHVISLAPTSTMASLQQRQHNNNNQLEQHQSQQQQHLTPESSELHGRHLRQSLERSNLLETNDGELRHHLRELHLADNKLDQLGDFSAYSEAYQQLRNPDELLDTSSSVGPPLRLKSQELEKLAPFLSLSNLELLDLSGNQLVRLHQHTFLGLLKLKHLDLSRNKLEFIDKHALVGLLALQNLKLNSNRLAQHQHQLNQFNQIICRGPLLELERLDLSQDAPPPAPSDQKWPPSLTAANQSASSPYFHPNPIPHQYQHHLQQQQQQQQQQYQPNKLTKQAHHLVLPNEIAICSPRLRQFHLRGLKLKYVQVNAFDNLNELERLDLSENLLEQVPLDALLYSRSNLSYTLRELDLSNTQIEFIAASSFKPLKHLERLNLSRMSQLISFDLASLVTHEEEGGHEQQQIFASEPEVVSGAQPQHWGPGSEQQQQQQRNSERFVNMNLRELRASQNKRLQSFHSSLRARIHFQRLELLDLAGSSELRELQLDKMIELSPPVANNQREQQRQLQVDVSHSNGLNCSACQMSWLVRAVKQQAATTGAMSALGGSVLPLASQMALHSSQPPAAARIAVPATSQLGWSPIPFDPYNSLSVDPTGNGGGATQLSALSKASQAANGQYSANWRQQNELAQLKLLNVEAIICAWPFSMPLVELLNLETNYAPLFNQDCAPQGDEHRPRYLAPADGTQPTSTTFDTPGSSSNFSTLSSSHLHHQAQPNHHYPQRAEARPTNTESTSTTPASLRPALDTPLWAASILVFGLLLIGVGKLIQLLLIYKRRSSTGDGLKISPSFTATTSLDDGSPTTSCSTGSTSPVLNPLCFGTSGALVGHGQHHHHHHNQTTAGKQQQQPTLITSTLPDGGCISTTLNNWPAKNQMLQAQRNQYGQRNEPQRQTMYAGNTRESLSAFAPGNCGGGEPQQQLANNYWPAPADERLELGPGARGSGGRMRDLRAKFQKSFSSSSSSSRTAAANMNSKRKREKKERDALHRSYQEHLRHHQHTAARDQNLNWPQHQQPQPQDSMGPLTVQVGAVAFNNNNQPETNRYNNNKSGDNNNETTRLATTMLPERRAQRPMFHLNAAAAATAPDYQFNGQACRPAAAATGGVQIKEFGGRLWPAGGGSKLKQSNLFLRFVERLSGRSDDDDGVQQKNNHGKTRTSPTAPGNSAGPPFAPGARGQSHVVCNQYDTTTAAVARRNLVVNYATGRRNNNYGDNGNGITSAPPLPPPPPPLPLPPGERAGGLQAQLAAATIYSNHLAEMEILNHYSVCGGGGAGETGDTGDDDERHDDEHRLDYNRGGQPMDWPATSGKRPGLERLERARPNNNLVQQQQQQLVTTTPGAHLNAHDRRAHGNIDSEQESLRVMTELHLHQAATATTTTAGNQQQQPRQQIEMGNDAGAQGDDDKKAPFALELLDYDVAGCTQLAALNECDRRTQGERVVQFDQDDSIYAHG